MYETKRTTVLLNVFSCHLLLHRDAKLKLVITENVKKAIKCCIVHLPNVSQGWFLSLQISYLKLERKRIMNKELLRHLKQCHYPLPTLALF